MNAQLAEKEETLKLVREFRESPGYVRILLPRINALADEHARACRSVSLPSDKRAEHIHAADAFEALAKYLDVLEKSLVQTIAEIKANKRK